MKARELCEKAWQEIASHFPDFKVIKKAKQKKQVIIIFFLFLPFPNLFQFLCKAPIIPALKLINLHNQIPNIFMAQIVLIYKNTQFMAKTRCSYQT